MKKIHLIRHAKSSWKNNSLADIDRPLNGRGIRSCEFMARHIFDAGCRFEHVYCSPAVRAQSTIDLISKQLIAKTSNLSIQWQIHEQLYTFDSRKLHQWCTSLDERASEIVIVGHNPAFTDFCNALSNSDIHNIPTCGYAQLIATEEKPWQKISETSFELASFLRPKKLMEM